MPCRSGAASNFANSMLGFTSLWAARCTIAGIEVMHAIRKGQVATSGIVSQTPGEHFYALAT